MTPALQKPTVVVVTTGGTIAATHDRETGAQPALSGGELLRTVPGLDALAEPRLVEFSNIDSIQMTPELWTALSRAVTRELAEPDVAGAVVVHGTDTMAEAAYFLELTLESDKPVAFVGAMRAASHRSPDGPANLYNGVLQVVSPLARDWGVTVSMNDRIDAARFVRKTHTANVATFDSGERGCLGCISGGAVVRYHSRPPRRRLPLPPRLARVFTLVTYSGSDGALIRFALDAGAEGLVIEGYGAGNVNEPTFHAIEEALARGVTVAVTSRAGVGATEPIYSTPGGGLTLARAGALIGGDLGTEKTRLLLSIALPTLGGARDALAPYLA